MDKCKITVLKRTIHQDLIDEYRTTGMVLCEHVEEGQEFIVESPFSPPEGFCSWAWADLRGDIMGVMLGAKRPWTKSDVAITCCTDGYRPVIFKIERVE